MDLGAWGYLRLVLLGALIGIPAALLAAGFLSFVHHVEHWLWQDLPQHLDESSPPWYLVIGLPVAGACLVAVARRFLPGDGGHSPLHGFAGKPPLLSYAPGIALAAIGTLSFGAVLGPEGPLIALGALVGILITRLARLGAQESAVLGNGRLVRCHLGALRRPDRRWCADDGGSDRFRRLDDLRSSCPDSWPPPSVISSSSASATGAGSTPRRSPSPACRSTPVCISATWCLATLVGVLTALVVVVVRRFGFSVSDGEKRIGMPLLLILGGLTVGLLAQTADWLGADAENVLFSGQAGVPAVVAEDSAKIVLILLVAKALAYGICLACGFRGGPVFPAIFLGVALATFPVIWFDVSPTMAVAVGAAAGMAAVTRMLLTPILFGALLVGPTGAGRRPGCGGRGRRGVARDRDLGTASRDPGSGCCGAGARDGN